MIFKEYVQVKIVKRIVITLELLNSANHVEILDSVLFKMFQIFSSKHKPLLYFFDQFDQHLGAAHPKRWSK